MTSEVSTPKILIVDDNKENIDLIAYFLKPQNYTIVTASDGVEALEKVEIEKPDIILLDIMLPKMDGFQVCEHIKKNQETRFIPVIMITALKELKDKIRALEVGADDFISKPFENVELLTRVKSLLRIKNYHDQLEEKNQELEEKNQELLKLDKFKEELSHLIVHDMKNPLFVIQGNLQMMEMGLGDSISPTVQKFLGRIDRSTQNLLRMVLNLIDIFKIEGDNADLNLELVGLNELAQKARQRLMDYPENEHKQINLNLVDKIPFIRLDMSMMERVMDNLISFGAANVPADGQVNVETFFNDHEVGMIIHDFGTQIPVKYSESMFDKFSQVEIKNEGYRLGRGLALTFSKLAIEAHGGQLTVDTENKVGNRFILTFPLNKK